jgi:hypothetical protein
MKAYDSDHNLKFDRKGESDQDINSDESRDARPETPSKKLVRRSLKPKKKSQRVRGLKDQFEACAPWILFKHKLPWSTKSVKAKQLALNT